MKKTLLTTLISSGCLLPLGAQVLPGAGSGNSAGGASSNNNSVSNDTVNNYGKQDGESTHGQEIPIVDPTNKTIEFQGRQYSLMDNNLGGQFEAFLATDTFSELSASEYRATIEQIQDLIAPNRQGGPNLKAAFDLLEKASEYPGDGNICESLGNSIYSALLTKQGIGSKKVAISRLEKERKLLIRNMGVLENRIGVETSQQSNQKGKKGQKQTTGPTSTEYLMMQKRLLQIEVDIRKLKTEGMIDLTQSKIQYQAMMVQLFIQRRFEHVVMSSRFYSLVFKDGDSKMRIKKGSDTEKFFSEGIGVNPTVAGMDAAANEAIRKVETLVSAFNNNMENKRLHAASERLVEAYAIGEFLPAVQTIPMKPKGQIQQYVQDANDMVKTLQARDLEQGEELNNSLKKQAVDYNASEAKSYINAMKTKSKGSVREAKMALYQMKLATTAQVRYNEEQRFKSAMTTATEAWPSNPDLDKIGEQIDKIIDDGTNGQDQLQIARKDFDNWKKIKSWTAIFGDQERLGGAFGFSQANEDKVRLDELRSIIKNKFEIVKAIEQADAFSKKGFHAAAWEKIHQTQKRFDDDIELSNAMGKYSSLAADFANLIARAQKIEDDMPGSAQALNYYLKAQGLNSDSIYANEGIERILNIKFNNAPVNADEPNSEPSTPASDTSNEDTNS